MPGGLFDQIEREPADKCLYKRITLDYTLELEIYNKEEIARARANPSFSREMEYKYAVLVGSVFSQLHVDKCVALGKEYDANLINPMARNPLGIDPGFVF